MIKRPVVVSPVKAIFLILLEDAKGLPASRHLSGPNRYAQTQTSWRTARSVNGANCHLLLSLRIQVCQPLTRTHVRLLGPCYKTGRLEPFRQLPLASSEPQIPPRNKSEQAFPHSWQHRWHSRAHQYTSLSTRVLSEDSRRLPTGVFPSRQAKLTSFPKKHHAGHALHPCRRLP